MSTPQSGLGRAFNLPPHLATPSAVVGEVVKSSWEKGTARVKTVEFGEIECYIGTGYADTDWPTSGSAQDNEQFGFKRPLRARERVIVLMLGNRRVPIPVILCSLMKVEHKMNKDPDNENRWILHVRDDVYFRTIEQAFAISVKKLLLQSEEDDIEAIAKKNVKVTAEDENVELSAGTDIVLSAESHLTQSAEQNVAVEAKKGTGSVKSSGDLTLESVSGNAVVKSTSSIQLGSLGTHPAVWADVLLQLLSAVFGAMKGWGDSHFHPCGSPGSPSGPPVVPLSVAIDTVWTVAAQEGTKSQLVKLD